MKHILDEDGHYRLANMTVEEFEEMIKQAE
jgi:hypothetical protein